MGTVDSDDVVLGFIAPPGAGTGGLPLQTLFGFERVHVPAGETVSVWLYPALTEFAHAAPSGERVPLAGEYKVWFGSAAAAKHGMGYVEASLSAQ